MFTATLCTTNNIEPWGANVPFELREATLSTTLSTKYTHFKNLQTNPIAVIVYKKEDLELIMKTKADIEVEKGGKAKVVFTVSWLRIVDNNIEDLDQPTAIAKNLKKHLV